MMGRTTRRSVSSVLAPEVCAASSRVASMLRNAGVSSITFSGIVPVTRWTQTMPHHEKILNGPLTPNSHCQS